jgi:hypothetical protein
MNKNYDEDTIALEIEAAVLAGKYRSATEAEKMLVRIGALENIVRSYKETIVSIAGKKAIRQ